MGLSAATGNEGRAATALLFLAPGDVGKGRVEPISWMRTCQAFAERGLDVSLATLAVRRPDAVAPGQVWRHFGVAPSFAIRTLRTPLHRRSSVRGFRLWGGAAGLRLAVQTLFTQALRPRPLVVYSRSPLLTVPFILLRRLLPRDRRPQIVFETHSLPRGRGVGVARGADLVVVTSRRLQADMTAQLDVPASRVLLAPLGPFNETRPRPKAEARATLGLPEKAVIACYCGKMFEEQNEFLLQAAVELRHRLTGFSLVLVGGNPAIDAWTRRRVGELGLGGCVTVAGFVEPSRVGLHQSAADVLVFHMDESLLHFEYCTPAKGYEYQAAARPIVATDIPLFEEVFGEDGERAVRVRDRTPAALARGIETALSLEDGGRSMIERAGRWISQRTWLGRADAVLEALGLP